MAKTIEVLLTNLSPEGLETLSAEVHQALRATCDRLGIEVSPSEQLPYKETSENTKELCRSSVRAVARFLLKELHGYMARCQEAETCWRTSERLVEHYKRGVFESSQRLRNIRDELDRRGIARCAACKGDGGAMLEAPGKKDGKDEILSSSFSLCPVCKGTGIAPSV